MSTALNGKIQPLRVTQARVIHSEWIKFWSLRSTVLSLAAGVALLVGVGLITASVSASGGSIGDDRLGAADASLGGVMFAQLAFGTLGVLFMAGEYGTGMIRSTLSAVPRRLPMLWAKIAVFSAVTFVTGLVATAIAFTGGQALIGDGAASWSDAGVARAVVNTAVLLTGSGLLGIAFGALLRSTAGAVTTVFGGLFLFDNIVGLMLPDSWQGALRYFPGSSGNAAAAVTQAPDTLAPYAGLAVFAGYVVLAAIAAAWRLSRSDA
ncbi:ABC transporter permease [Jidongwangia harbinensis]|uniref:ABC transporter permease n=1 Tax=Jidongwangia harbinensis TaxID=2878561 RepID=UPI001CD9A729|nr:ABC transporter permease [Jidongwangia harbinensis]MCA2217437.1 ABC transporter permease [Jidongwangia harbinensis]